MAHSQETAGAVDVPETPDFTDVDSAAAALADTLEDDMPDEHEGQDEPITDPEEELDEFDEGEDEEAEGDEPETAIAAPASLNAEEKEAFKQLPPEAQQFVNGLETRRNTQVQEATTKAANAQRNAEAAAANAETEAKRRYGQELEAFASQLVPQAPDPRLAEQNPSAYIAQKAQYEAQVGHYQNLVDQVRSFQSQTEEEAQANFIKQRDQALLQIPEIANPETREAYISRAFNPDLMQALGYTSSDLQNIVDAEDVKRLHTIAGMFEDAGKYRKAMSKRMERVREGKKRTVRPGTAQRSSSGQSRADKAFSDNPSRETAAAMLLEHI